MLDFAKEAIENPHKKTELEIWKENRKKIRRYNNEPETTVTYLKFTDKLDLDWIRIRKIVEFEETKYITS